MEEDELHRNPFLSGEHSSLPVPRLQFRKDVSRARWDDGLGMGEVIERKGSLWTGIGIVRNRGKLYCLIEEILFLVERGALHLLDTSDKIIALKDIYEKVTEGKNGCSWELYVVYRRLKSLGYIVGRHGVSWTSKEEKTNSNFIETAAVVDSSSCLSVEDNENKVIEKFSSMEINDARPAFDVYLPDSKFKKSAPGNPNFVLCITRGKPPTRIIVRKLERMCCGIPLKFCHVDHWLVTFLSVEKIDLPVLP